MAFGDFSITRSLTTIGKSLFSRKKIIYRWLGVAWFNPISPVNVKHFPAMIEIQYFHIIFIDLSVT